MATCGLVLPGRHAHRFRAAPGDRAHVGVGETVDLQHLHAGGVDFVGRLGQLEPEQARALVQPLGMLASLNTVRL